MMHAASQSAEHGRTQQGLAHARKNSWGALHAHLILIGAPGSLFHDSPC